MKPSRRGFLKLLGVAPVATPKVPELLDSVLAPNVQAKITPPVMPTLRAQEGLGEAVSSINSRLENFKQRVLDIDSYVANVRAFRKEVRVLDPDLAALRSFSAATKLTIQAIRDRNDTIESDRKYYQTEIERMLAQMIGTKETK